MFPLFVFNHVRLCNKPLSISIADLAVTLVVSLVFVDYVILLIVL
jgi:hypothetical protein